MWKGRLILVVFLALCLGCKDNGSINAEAQGEPSQTNEKRITKSTVEKLKYQDYVLSRQSEALVESWPKYQELLSQIELLKQAEFSFFGGDKETVKGLLKDLKAEIPEQVNTNPVQSRIVVMETSIFKLHNELNLDIPNRSELLKSITEVLSAVSSLNLQINKKLEFDANNVDRPE